MVVPLSARPPRGNEAMQLEKGTALSSLPDVKWSPKYYLTYRGAENYIVMVWLLKDIGWNQGYYKMGEIFGFIALAWSVVLCLRAIWYRCISESIISFCQVMWLTSNNVWMYGELQDLSTYGDWGTTYAECTIIAGDIMLSAFCIYIFFFMFLRPSTWLDHDRENELVVGFNEIGLKPRFPQVFQDYREWEALHLLFWLGKDCGWNHKWPVMWIIFVVPTTIIALDFIWISFWRKGAMVEFAHYIAYFFWLLGNSLWAIGDLWFSEDASALRKFYKLPDSWSNFRWWGGWSFIMAFVPLILLYLVWIPASLMGKIKENPGHGGSDNEGEGAAYNGSMQTLSDVLIDDLPRKSGFSEKGGPMGVSFENEPVPSAIDVNSNKDDTSVDSEKPQVIR